MKRTHDDTTKRMLHNNNNRARKSNGFYTELAVNKVKNKYEEAIQFQWIHLIARKYSIFNIDNSHQCFSTQSSISNNNNNNKHLSHQPHSTGISRKSNSSIITPFPVVAPNFYGCTICGKYHFCNIDRRVCEIVSDELDRIEMCRYSGKVLLVQDNLEPDMFSETQKMNATRDTLTFDKYVQASYIPKGVKEKSSVSNNKKIIHTKKKQKLISRLKENEKQLAISSLKKKSKANKNKSKKDSITENIDDGDRGNTNITLAQNCDISIDSLSDDYDDDDDDDIDEEYKEDDHNMSTEDRVVDNNQTIHTGDITNENDNDDIERCDDIITTIPKNQLHYQTFECDSYYSEDDDFLDTHIYDNIDGFDDSSTESTEISKKRDTADDGDKDNTILAIINASNNRRDEEDLNNVNDLNHYVDDDDCDTEYIKELIFGDDGNGVNDDDEDNNGVDEYGFIDTGCGGAYTKNYHNNLEYNNRYYSFINTIIRKWKRKNDLHDLYNRDIQLNSKTLRSNISDSASSSSVITTTTNYTKVETSPILGCKTNNNDNKNKDELERDQKHKYRFTLTVNAQNRIRTETEKIITQLLDIQKKIMSSSIDTSELNNALVQYFTVLISNITSLIYGSDKIDTIATIRNMKNQKQQKTTENLSKLLVTTIDLNDIEKNSAIKEHEYTLDPKRICRSLLYSLLVEPFALNDSFGNRIDIWFRDSWLHTVNKFHTRNARERKEISKTNNIITECLASYNWCPIWVRSMIFNNIT